MHFILTHNDYHRPFASDVIDKISDTGARFELTRHKLSVSIFICGRFATTLNISYPEFVFGLIINRIYLCEITILPFMKSRGPAQPSARYPRITPPE